jgi:hypothetical protein
MPATLLGVAGAIGWLPQSLDRRGRWGEGARAALLPMVGLFIVVYLIAFARLYAQKQIVIGSGPDQFRSDVPGDDRGKVVKLMFDEINQLPPGATLAVMPEGVMLNYLGRRENPTPYINLMPPEVIMFGQDSIVRAFAEHPPDFIVMVPVSISDPSDYGFRDFRKDYGREVSQWIEENYTSEPTVYGENFPMKLMRRK